MSGRDEFNEGPIRPGAAVVVTLHTPREKLWGVLGDVVTAGIYLRGIDLNTFDDWTKMIVRGERNIGLSYMFLPMWRVERINLDESVDDIQSLSDSFFARVGITLKEYLGYE